MERMTHRETPENTAYVDRGLVNLSWYSMTDEGYRGPAIDRLAAYEDTGLDPGEIAQQRFIIAARKDPEKLAHLRDIVLADEAGRLVVIPQAVPSQDKVRWLNEILAERDRQDRKWGFPQENTYCEWASILAEEVGELCKELNELNYGRGDRQRMEAEAVQVAAVALAILEQADVARVLTVKAAMALDRLDYREGMKILGTMDGVSEHG